MNRPSDSDHGAVLNEKEAKDLLRSFGIPTVEEHMAADADAAVAAALRLGFPAVVKGVIRGIPHKSERGLVHLDLGDENAVRRAAEAVEAAAGPALEALLVQPHLAGRREFLAGLVRDRQFGPVVIFGVGGVLAEAVRDVSHRLAPLTEADALEMLSEIRARAFLEEFRGEAAVDRQQLARTLLGLSRIAVERPDVVEIDINPLLVSAEGHVCAVDALAVLGDTRSAPASPPVPAEAIGQLFHPRSIAFIGASGRIGKWGHTLLANTISGGYEGDIHPVNPKGGVIAGRAVHRAVKDIAGRVDLAVVTVPAAAVPQLIPELADKGIANMLLISSGFGETGAEGKALELDLVHAARAAGILILGPNTMGICNPHIHFYCTGSSVAPQPGGTTIVSQSGNMGVQFLSFAEQQGIGIRAFCGSGNEAMITIEDFLEGLERDGLTRTVVLYVESLKNARRFFAAARRVGRSKPVVLLKGGRSRAGSRAAATHSGALAHDGAIFDAACRQAGVVTVEEPMELLDQAAAFSSLPLPAGSRAAIMTWGGGWGVITADLCNEHGLDVPDLPQGLKASLDRLLPAYWSRTNPVDLVGERDPQLPIAVIEELLAWEGCDGVIDLGIMGRRIVVERFGRAVLKADPDYSPDFIDSVNRSMEEFENRYVEHIVRLMERLRKPVYGVSLLDDHQARTVYRVGRAPYQAVFYPTPERAVKAFARMHRYRRFLERGE